ncbi:asparagine synthase (glutamine-hydrolyzing) [Paraglaciecola aquimarina]|uniref:asparagine synthase (glutamine-hydrolyzing) n=1 Tax=Paraglaciecola aquimarina TaxID=1235557 RepID=A0ABU3T284_9ALTE|nr:asparagine synthase (glutamine-hydrolyzing) [Paraglaciecola aquimarina]MDU0356379.1 asparagine synthase (glutamine-hydrolyzing) [Paraglaciecola aquimarina]
MCGIVCWVRANGQVHTDDALFKKMTRSLEHRGPDGEGFYVNKSVALGHTRLAIVDIDNGQQPMSRDTTVVTFNGEIYNFPELKQELETIGFVFETHCDTEVLLHGWAQWGSDLINKLRGMFAFVILDKLQNKLYLVRDRFGIKPLYWALADDGDLLVASELKALKLHPKLNTDLCEQAIEDFFSLGYIVEPKSIYKSVKKLAAGHYMEVDIDDFSSLSEQPYWVLKDHLNSDYEDVESLKHEFQQLLSESVRLRMMADVQVGAFLSGGVDSTVIVGSMSQHTTQAVKTSSIGFDLSAYDESYYAKKVASHFQCDHVNTSVSVNDLSLVDKIVDIYDEPFADNSAIPTYILSQATNKYVKVALSGDGADELFFGYRNHQMFLFEERLRKIIPSFMRNSLLSGVAKFYPESRFIPKLLRAKTTFEGLSNDKIDGYHNAISISAQKTLQTIYSDKFKRMLNKYSSLGLFRSLAKEVGEQESLKQVQYIDFKTYLPGSILTKVDRASMANSLEVRVPFLDHKLVEWGLRIKPKVNLGLRTGKKLIAKSFAKLVPSYILNRKKMGFTSPLDEWFRQIPLETLESRVLSQNLLSTDYFDIQGIHNILLEHHQRKKSWINYMVFGDFRIVFKQAEDG